MSQTVLFGASSRWAQPTVMGFLFSGGSLVTRWELPGGFGAFPVCGWPTIFLQYFDAVGWVF